MNALYKKYPYIVAWGWMMGSYKYYVDDQVELANRDGAPVNAIYKDSDGVWHTVDGVVDVNLRHRLQDRVLGRRSDTA